MLPPSRPQSPGPVALGPPVNPTELVSASAASSSGSHTAKLPPAGPAPQATAALTVIYQ